MIRQAAILAAGSGMRLGRNLPKGLTRVADRPLLAWIIESLQQVGVTQVHLIVSARPAELVDLASELSTNMAVTLAQCPDWQLGNGRSAAFAEQLIADDRFYLMMSDHLVTAQHLQLVAAAPSETCVLGTSAPAPWIDIADATKVMIDDAGAIREIGKELTAFNGIDTGVFAMTRAIFPALEAARAAGEYSLTAGNKRLGQQGLLHAAPVGDCRWYDIDTPTDLAGAEAWLSRAKATR